MKKYFTFAVMGLSAFMASGAVPEATVTEVKLAAAAAPLAITPVSTDIITQQPDGTLTEPLYCASGTTYLIYNGALGGMTNNGYAGAMVRTDDAVYIRNIISEYSVGTDYWIKGDVEADGTVTFKFPQQIAHRAATSTTTERDFYVALLTPKSTGTSVTLSVDEAKCDMQMKWEGDRLVQIIPETSGPLASYQGILGVVDGEGSFMGYGEQQLSYKIVDTTPLAPPASAQMSQYVIKYKNGEGADMSGVVTVGTDGNDVWFKGFNTFIPEAWVKGTLAGDVVTVPATYTGVTYNYFTYIMGLSEDKSQLIDHLTIQKTADGYKVDGTMIINLGDEIVDLNDNRVFSDIVMTPYVAGVKTPAAPVIDRSEEGTEAWTEAEGLGALVFTLDAVDTDGQPLDTEKLYYTVFKNGEPYTFKKDDYFLEEDLTDVPYNFQSDLIMSMSGYFFVFFIEDMDSIGVRAVYKDGDNITYSPTDTFVFRNSVSDAVADSPVVSAEYFGLDGVKLAAPADGVCIKVSHHADGSITAAKVIVRK